MNKTAVHEVIKRHLIPSGDYIYGFADLTRLLPETFSDYSSGISILRKLDDKIVDGIKNAPTPEYYKHYSDINDELKDDSGRITLDLRGEGIDAVAIQPTISINSVEFDKYLPTLRYEISHKMVGTRAGLGWIGKTDLFISPKFGARLRLTSILTSLKLEPELKPVDRSKCGICNICVKKCPAQAASGKLWDIHTDRDVFFDAFRCREKCSEFGLKYLKIDKRICGICVAVCPIGRT